LRFNWSSRTKNPKQLKVALGEKSAVDRG